MTNNKKLSNSDVAQVLSEAFKPLYYFGANPSVDSFSVPVPGNYLNSSFVAAISGSEHQDIIDLVLRIPASMRDFVFIRQNETIDIHCSLLPDFGIPMKMVANRGGMVQ